MKKLILPTALFFSLFAGSELYAQEPTVKKENTVTTPEKKDSDSKKGRDTGVKGKSEKMSIGEEGDSDDKKKSTNGTNTGTTTKSPTVKPNTSRNPK